MAVAVEGMLGLQTQRQGALPTTGSYKGHHHFDRCKRPGVLKLQRRRPWPAVDLQAVVGMVQQIHGVKLQENV